MIGGDVILEVMLFRDNWRYLRAAESKSDSGFECQ